MTNDNQFDELLHAALSEYREAEPLTGLEERILQRLQAQPAKRRSLWRMWGAVATCVALVLIVAWIVFENRTIPHLPTAGKYGPPESAPLTASEPAYPGPDLPVPSVARPNPAGAAHISHKPAPVVQTQTVHQAMPAVFPSPTPLTPEERAFLAALQRGSEALPAASVPDADITIAEIEIKPLSMGGLSSSDNPGEKQ